MLVLTRRVGESIMIDDDIKITIIADKHPHGRKNAIRLGFEAPKERKIHRQELYDAIKNADKL